MAKTRDVLLDPLIDNNPIGLQVLGICSALAVTTQLATAIEAYGPEGGAVGVQVQCEQRADSSQGTDRVPLDHRAGGPDTLLKGARRRYPDGWRLLCGLCMPIRARGGAYSGGRNGL